MLLDDLMALYTNIKLKMNTKNLPSQFTSMIVRQSSPWQMHILQLRVQAYRHMGKLW